jgi:hypothetical protein
MLLIFSFIIFPTFSFLFELELKLYGPVPWSPLVCLVQSHYKYALFCGSLTCTYTCASNVFTKKKINKLKLISDLYIDCL